MVDVCKILELEIGTFLLLSRFVSAALQTIEYDLHFGSITAWDQSYLLFFVTHPGCISESHVPRLDYWVNSHACSLGILGGSSCGA